MSKNRPYKHVTASFHARLVRRGFSRNQSREALKGHIPDWSIRKRRNPISMVTKNHYVFNRDVDIILTTKTVEIDDGENTTYLNHKEFIAWLNSVTSVYYSNE